MRPPTSVDAGKDRATPSFLDASVFTAGRNSHVALPLKGSSSISVAALIARGSSHNLTL